MLEPSSQVGPCFGVQLGAKRPNIEEIWYKPVAIDGIAVKEILALAGAWSPGREMRFAQDRVSILMRLDWKGDHGVLQRVRAITPPATAAAANSRLMGHHHRSTF